MIFICQFVNVMYHINWFMEIEKSLLPWAKSHLIMRYTSVNVCWNQFASILLRVFASMFTSDMTCNFLFCAIFISFWYQGDGLSSVIFWKHFRRIDVNSSINGWQDLPVKPFCYILLFVGGFNITVSISVFVIGLFLFSLSSWFSLGSLYLSKNLSISSIFYQDIVACVTLLWSFVFLWCLL